MEELLSIHYERTGGFAGLHLKKTIIIADLPISEAHEIQDLIENASFFSLPENLPSPEPGVDRFHYLIEVTTSDRQHRVEFGESAAIGKIKPLVDKLNELARRLPQEKGK